ncbi:YihY/virulence factor BrkB family protein [Devosia sp. XJ19-1]|uniref:YihY/virulence factor BrkB family protein n=1 Tax=Devosia ureilytica TaxID=2952754 RepID=A0A9Q4APS8_9HYPH|nr:YihY/virulence factor BrkB family protein [Devosia ureilytica]MCP8883869.1 YihY/virulence factor BrkB family protein [Devosia ureilytica]MCP8887477.1 YihY/virulence factor BrkB family protein [Devosia ureilytica]
MAPPNDPAWTEGRGRQADEPKEIPRTGWKDIAGRLARAIGQNHILLTAAGVSFYLLLSLVPTLTAFVSIYGLFNDRASVLDQVELLRGIVPPGALSVVTEQLTRLTSESNDTLGWTLIVSLGIALWSASAGVKALFEAMNVAYREQERRNFFHIIALSLLFTLGGAVAAVLIVSVVLVMPLIVSLLPMGAGLEWTVRIASYLAMLLLLSLMIAALYRWGPSRQQAKWRWITPGVVLAVVALGAGSVGFSWYVANFSDDNAAYGSLGAVIGLMTWLWISATVIIVGAMANAEIEHQTAQDSTTGAWEPLGQRGAYVADHVGAPWPGEDVSPKAHRRRNKVSLGGLVFAIPAAMVMLAVERQRPGNAGRRQDQSTFN